MNTHRFLFFIMSVFLFTAVNAQKTMDCMQLLTVNENITTVITASEPVRFVDISTDKVVGDQPISNTIRLKPKEGVEVNRDGDILGMVTIVTERYRSQYGLVYTSRPEEAVTDKTILLDERTRYDNPAVSLSTEDMAHYARRIWLSPSKGIRSSKKHKMQIALNNIYSVGEYFFLDFSVYNRTNIRFDIDQLKIKLQDKKKAKATTVQTIDLEPAFTLDRSPSFLHGYRNVVVIRKLTFPDDKILTIELSEKQISGRTISLKVKYSDVLSADAFSRSLK